MRAFTPKGWTRPILTSDNPNLKQWRQLVAVGAGEKMQGAPIAGAVVLIAAFYMPRPKSMSMKVRQHTKKPDLDKLVRALKDALKGVVWVDDSQVVSLSATKEYADNAPVGVHVIVREL